MAFLSLSHARCWRYEWSQVINMAASDGCPCTVKQFFVWYSNDVRRGKSELPTAGDVEWLLFSYT